MAETREADARRFKAMAIRDGRIVGLAREPDGADDLIGTRTPDRYPYGGRERSRPDRAAHL